MEVKDKSIIKMVLTEVLKTQFGKCQFENEVVLDETIESMVLNNMDLNANYLYSKPMIIETNNGDRPAYYGIILSHHKVDDDFSLKAFYFTHSKHIKKRGIEADIDIPITSEYAFTRLEDLNKEMIIMHLKDLTFVKEIA